MLTCLATRHADEDECEMSKHNCHVNADCTNAEGGYECTCINGFNGDGFMCHG